MRILAMVNQKGGCGKTTTAINLAWRFAAMGKKTVLIDLDPQGHATLGTGRQPPALENSLASVLSRSGLDPAVRPLHQVLVDIDDNLRLAPSGAELAGLEPDLVSRSGAEERLAEHLAPLTVDTDLVVIDAPPSLGLLTLNALTAAGEAIVPVEPSLYALHGLARITELTGLMENRTRHSVEFRILLNMFDGRTRFARMTRKEIERSFKGMCLETTVRQSIRVREAAARGMPVERFTPGAPIVEDYRSLASELERSELKKPQVAGPEVQGLVVRPEGIYLTSRDLEPEQISLAGDFNGWVPDSGVVLEYHQEGGWTKFIPLTPGRYEYKLVMNGRWVTDPLNPKTVPNRVGSVNSVLEIDG